jgi:hypothetical protein
MTRLRRPLTIATASIACIALALAAVAQAGGGGHATAPRARASSSHPLVGLGNETARMFRNGYYTQLHTKIVRYIAPYDAVAHRYSLDQAITFIQGAEANHEQVLVSFYHSEYSPLNLPSVAQYQRDVAKFIKIFQHVKQYQAWDEANRGYIPHAEASPSADTTAKYYQALLRVCKGCNVIGLDVLDQQIIGPTLEYIREFKEEIGRLRTIMPTIWGLHNYSDVNRLESWRTRDIIKAFGGGQTWLTETGGIVQFGGAFSNVHGSGLTRAQKVIQYMFRLAGVLPQVKRMYVYDWTGGVASTRFDAGLTNVHEQPRPGYVVVCEQLHATHCNNVKTARN